MAKSLEVKINTTEGMEKIEALRIEAEKLKTALARVKQAAEETVKAMQEFVKACSNIKVGS